MATETMNYGYPKPGEDDFYDITQYNQALDMIDQDMKEMLRSDGDTKDNVVTFHSGDMENPTGWAEIVPVESGEIHSSLWRKISLGIKNLRYLKKMLGSTDISKLGDGTITGALGALNTEVDEIVSDGIVTRIKGENESFFRTGDTEISIENILKRKTVELDVSASKSWQNVELINLDAMNGIFILFASVYYFPKKLAPIFYQSIYTGMMNYMSTFSFDKGREEEIPLDFTGERYKVTQGESVTIDMRLHLRKAYEEGKMKLQFAFYGVGSPIVYDRAKIKLTFLRLLSGDDDELY
ncbi:hypothetical protein C806_00057 [Lachnospiraceae bacterium 3-1]|nr:hypothetical protein C806_00057 [Lachnospiraceae bacterium 3-1]